MSSVTQTAPWSDDARIVGLVGLAHGVSHFFHLILAPLYPWLRDAYGYSYAELGFIMTVFFVVSGGFQAVAGFIVDRYGALPTLMGGLFCLTSSAVVLGTSDSYAMLLVGAMLAGLGNSVFHPVDFWFINHRISVPRLGPAYSAHGLSGSLGWALAPIFLVGIATPFGWRAAVLAAAGLPLVVIALFLVYRAVLGPRTDVHSDAQRLDDPAHESRLRFLRDPDVWWCFAFFVVLSIALGGVQSFSPTIFMTSYGLAVTTAALSITVYMVASALGMVSGAWLVMRRQRLEQNITLALTVSVIAAVLIGFPDRTGCLRIRVDGDYGLRLRPVRPVTRHDDPHRHAGRGDRTGLRRGLFRIGYRSRDRTVRVRQDARPRLLCGSLFGVAVCLFVAVLTAWRVAAEERMESFARKRAPTD